ncbi:DUF1707 domain-containing protein [Nonomuraea sp. NPDC050536]|uniref:DUF1707 SHOCT-like domain-containing protein n=1 Tax=Nonomuraea sp. NPDC050536 TaxID=3364366 RepID=UPI0037C82556
MTDPGELRASDAEREAVVELLREASVEGRLTLSELTERTEAAYSAKTHAELDLVTQDLPSATRPAASTAPKPPGGAFQQQLQRARKWFVGVLGENKRRGAWRIDEEIGATAVLGEVVLDLREAEVRTDVVDIMAIAVLGNVKIIVPDGVYVDLDGVAVLGERKLEVAQAPQGMNVPVIRIHAYAMLGEIKILGDSRAQPLRRAMTAWQEQWRQLHGADWQSMRRDLHAGWREARREMHEEWRDSRRQMQEDLRDARRRQRRDRRGY